MFIEPEFNDLTFSRAKSTHLSELKKMEQNSSLYSWSNQQITDCFTDDYFIHIVTSDETQESLIGYWIFQAILDELHLLNLVVSKEHQGKGHGRLILTHLKDCASQNGIKRILLEVRESNQIARNLYSSLGFSALATRKGYYPGENEHREDAIVMDCLLS